MAATLEKVLSGGLAKARDGAIIKTGRLLPNGEYKGLKGRKEQQSQSGKTERGEQSRRCSWRGGPCREGLVGLVRAVNFNLSLGGV